METRFKTIRLEYQELLRDKNHKSKFTQENLSKAFEDYGFYISREKIGKLETGDDGAAVTKDIILAYCKFFHVSADWLLGLSETRYTEGDLFLASKATGLSENAVESLGKYSPIEKSILNLLIENGAIDLVLAAVYNYYPNFFDKTEKAISDEVGFKFNRFMSMELFQQFLDKVHLDQRFSNIMFEVHSKEYKAKLTNDIGHILAESLSEEGYEEYRRAGKKYGFNLPEIKHPN